MPDPLVPAPANAVWWTSPDIKVNHAPFFAPSGVFDGVDFDINLTHQDVQRGESNRVYLQVHNRGWKPTSAVSVRAFVADASAGLPALPNALAPPAFNLTSTAVWSPVGPAKTIAQILPNRPVVVSWDFVFPATSATHTCCLAVVSSADDPFVSPATDIATLVTADKRACLHNLHVISGPAPMSMTLVAIDFNNATDADGVVELRVRPSQFERGTISLVLPPAEITPDQKRSSGVQCLPLAPDDPLGSWYTPGSCADTDAMQERWNGLDRTRIWLFSTVGASTLAGLQLRAGETLRAAMVFSHRRDVATIIAPRVTLEQRMNGVSVGGSTFQIGFDEPQPPAPAD